MWLGCSATPADNAILWFLQRITTTGTGGSTPTPQPLDPGDPAAAVVCNRAHSTDPTYTANAVLLRLALNQRATHRVQFDPDAPAVIPATAANGLGLYPSHSTFTGNVDATIHFAE